MILINTYNIGGLWAAFAAGMLSLPAVLIVWEDIFIPSPTGETYVFNKENHNINGDLFAHLNENSKLTEDFLQQINSFGKSIFISKDNNTNFMNINGQNTSLTLSLDGESYLTVQYGGEYHKISEIINIGGILQIETITPITNIKPQGFLQTIQEISNYLGVFYNKLSEFNNVSTLPHSTTTGVKFFQY